MKNPTTYMDTPVFGLVHKAESKQKNGGPRPLADGFRIFTPSEIVSAAVAEWRTIIRDYERDVITDPGDMTSQTVGILRLMERLGLDKQYDAARDGESNPSREV